MDYPESLSETHFIKLTLKQGENLLSENFYWRGTEYLNYQAMETMQPVELRTTAFLNESDDKHTIDVSLSNESNLIALAIRLKVVQENSGERVLPAFFEDNYFSLLPGESRTISIEFDKKDLNGENTRLLLEGWNLNESQIELITDSAN